MSTYFSTRHFSEMKIVLTILFLLTIGQEVEIEKLKAALTELQNENTVENQRKYFELFPDTFESFEKTFGFKDNTAAPLYSNSHIYIQQFFSLDNIPKKERFEKWINIAIGGHWDADAINYFQHDLRPRILKDTELAYNCLKQRTDNEIESFFYFFFHSIHPVYKTVPSEFEIFKTRDNKFYNLIVAGHTEAIEDSGH